MSLFKYFIRNMLASLQSPCRPRPGFSLLDIDVESPLTTNSKINSTNPTREFADFKNPTMNSKQDLVWIDMEMTGLNLPKDRILEVACIITDVNLNIKAPALEIIIHQPDDILQNMNEWCMKHHGESGLIQASKQSQTSISQAEDHLLTYLQNHIPKGECPLAGNSVHCDREFLKKYMPKVNEYLHYRIVDVSTVKELCRRWNNNVYRSFPKKKLCHRALDDIKESIEELKYYQKHFFILK